MHREEESCFHARCKRVDMTIICCRFLALVSRYFDERYGVINLDHFLRGRR